MKKNMDIGTFNEKQVLDLAMNAYESGEAAFDIVSEKCALLVIDMQNEYVKPHWSPDWVPEATRQVPHIKMLIEYCRNKQIPVIYTIYAKTHNYLDRPKSGKFMPNRHSDLGIDLSLFNVNGQVWHELTPREDEIVIKKSSYGAFYDTPLETILKNMEKDTIIICGTLTNFCCGATARQGYERSFKVVFISDATSSDNSEMQENELRILRRGFAKVLSVDALLKKL
jgi:nicotinamidase-related amidase